MASGFTALKEGSTKTQSYQVLLKFTWEKNQKQYLIYTKNKTDKEGNLIIYAASYLRSPNKLLPLTTTEEWNLIENILTQITTKISDSGE